MHSESQSKPDYSREAFEAILAEKAAFLDADPELRARFDEELARVELEDVLWPERRPEAFARPFRMQPPEALRKAKGRSAKKTTPSKSKPAAEIVYPLADPLRRIQYAERKIEQLTRHPTLHPALAYLYIAQFQAEFGLPPAKRGQAASKEQAAPDPTTSPGSGRIRLDDKRARQLYNKAAQLKKKLSVSKRILAAKSVPELEQAIFAEFARFSHEYVMLQEQNKNLELELEVRRENLDEAPGTVRRSAEDLAIENESLREQLEYENGRVERLEEQLGRLTEQLSAGVFQSDSEIAEEYSALRQEYGALSQKYDALVSKNIELSNHLDRVTRARALEEILNSIRDKINGVLRSGMIQDDEALLHAIQGEIAQLQRARLYLGRALHDVGMLYLRAGDRGRALTELRAARELGVEDGETNRIIQSLSAQ